ncbi:MAG: ATP-dependent DNA helicase RecG [Clostridiales bacterium]|nr:ATP-dependent DNA helicase RecG [Clostridiales bacterium]
MELTSIKGIGEARKKSFEENGIFSCEDLINYFPYKYYDFTKTEPFADDGNVRLIKATAIETPKTIRARAITFVTCKMNDEVGHTFTATWFNQTYVSQVIYLGQEVFLYGKNSPTKKNNFVVTMFKPASKITGSGLLPIYSSIDKIGQATLNDSINKSLEMLNISTFIPSELLYKYNLTDLHSAYKSIHNPLSKEEAEKARERIEIENLIPILAGNEYNKLTKRTLRTNNYKNITNLMFEYEKLLPFSLTADQRKAIFDIENDFSSKFSMNRLLQGDVGSGKTVVALFGSFISAKNGFQSAIVAPTEILATQHYETALKLFSSLGITVRLLTSSVKGIKRKIILNEIESGEAQIVIGTHSLLSSEVTFKNLSYAVIDEQHKFGVEQRASIKEKGLSVDILVMSATPIPRSLSLVVYGSLEISTLLSRPKSANITTNIVIKSKQNDMWNYIKNKLLTGSKAYVVCSKIDEENENDSVIKFSAKNTYDYLRTVFNDREIGLIHGKLKKETQNSVIEKFRKGIIKVLVSTTIVEVGVDIPNSDLMVIATPERFGLATLHQLRGRIGRNGEEAYCFCLADNLSGNSLERINYFRNHTNGFDIAEFDLKTRGAGSIMGTNQHGIDSSVMSNFSVYAYTVAKEILEQIKPNINLYSKILAIYHKNSVNEHSPKIVLN